MNRHCLSSISRLLGLALAVIPLTACKRPPPSERPAVTLAEYTRGDADKGKSLYQDECEKCHKLQPGNNEKGPQLMRIYGAKAGLLADYKYSDAMKNSQKIWTADELDKYIANPKQYLPGTRMRSDPMTNPNERKDVITYLSTLR